MSREFVLAFVAALGMVVIAYLVNQIPSAPILKSKHGLVWAIAGLFALTFAATWITTRSASDSGDDNPHATPRASTAPIPLSNYERLSRASLAGPPRKEYEKPPDRALFNCLEKSSFLNPEAEFVWARAGKNGGWHTQSLEVSDGGIYDLAVYPINCGAYGSDYRHNWIEGATLELGYTRAPARQQRVGAVLTSTNAPTVWAGVRLTAERPFTITPIKGSIDYMSAKVSQEAGMHLPDSAWGQAHLIGDDGFSGLLTPCKPGGNPQPACAVLIYAKFEVHMKS